MAQPSLLRQSAKYRRNTSLREIIIGAGGKRHEIDDKRPSSRGNHGADKRLLRSIDWGKPVRRISGGVSPSKPQRREKWPNQMKVQ